MGKRSPRAKVHPVRSLDDIIDLPKRSVVKIHPEFENPESEIETAVYSRVIPKKLNAEFLIPWSRRSADKNLTIVAYECPVELVEYSPDGLIRLPSNKTIMNIYEPGNPEYASRLRVLRIFN